LASATVPGLDAAAETALAATIALAEAVFGCVLLEDDDAMFHVYFKSVSTGFFC
jgi:hypothetical protein